MKKVISSIILLFSIYYCNSQIVVYPDYEHNNVLHLYTRARYSTIDKSWISGGIEYEWEFIFDSSKINIYSGSKIEEIGIISEEEGVIYDNCNKEIRAKIYKTNDENIIQFKKPECLLDINENNIEYIALGVFPYCFKSFKSIISEFGNKYFVYIKYLDGSFKIYFND